MLSDLLTLSGGFGASVPTAALEGEHAEALARAVRSASLEVVTGRRDHRLRRLLFVVELTADVSPAVAEATATQDAVVDQGDGGTAATASAETTTEPAA